MDKDFDSKRFAFGCFTSIVLGMFIYVLTDNSTFAEFNLTFALMVSMIVIMIFIITDKKVTPIHKNAIRIAVVVIVLLLLSMVGIYHFKMSGYIGKSDVPMGRKNRDSGTMTHDIRIVDKDMKIADFGQDSGPDKRLEDLGFDSDLYVDLSVDAGIENIKYGNFNAPMWLWYKNSISKTNSLQEGSNEKHATKELIAHHAIMLKAYEAEAREYLSKNNELPPKNMTCWLCRTTMALEGWCSKEGCEYEGGVHLTPPKRLIKFRTGIQKYLKNEDKVVCKKRVSCE